MRVALIGAGNVGKQVFHDLQQVGMISEITLVGRNKEKLMAEVLDAKDAQAVRRGYEPKLYYGGYEKTAGADIIIYTAGSAEVKKDRMEMLHANCEIAEEIFSEVKKYNRDAIIICVTNPLDVITMKVRQVMDLSPGKVIGTGTLLESARVVQYLSELLDVSDKSINVAVVGEHGASAVALFSQVRINGLTLNEYFKSITGDILKISEERLHEVFKKEPFKIFYGKGYTSTGVSATACKVVSAIAHDSREILTVSSVLQGAYGVQDVAVSVPSIVGRNGIEAIQEVHMSEDEKTAFLASVEVIREAAKSAGIL